MTEDVERDGTTVRLTQQEAQANLLAVLQLCGAGGLRCSAPGGSATPVSSAWSSAPNPRWPPSSPGTADCAAYAARSGSATSPYRWKPRPSSVSPSGASASRCAATTRFDWLYPAMDGTDAPLPAGGAAPAVGWRRYPSCLVGWSAAW